MALIDDEQVVHRHSCRTLRTQRSAKAFALGAWKGVSRMSIPSAANTASNEWVNLVSWIRNNTF